MQNAKNLANLNSWCEGKINNFTFHCLYGTNAEYVIDFNHDKKPFHSVPYMMLPQLYISIMNEQFRRIKICKIASYIE